MKIPLKHHFLVAMPGVIDPLFKHSVIYICQYDTNGVIGIMINKPIKNLKILDILTRLKITLHKTNSLQLKNQLF